MADGSTQPGTRGRAVLITAGIGFETARPLAERGAQVPITGRDGDRGERAAAAIRGYSGNERVSFLQADHSTVGGNEELATRARRGVDGVKGAFDDDSGDSPTA